MLMDVRKGWLRYRDAWLAETRPRCKAILAQMMEHIKWEVLGVPEGVLKTVAPGAVYRFYGTGRTLEWHDTGEIRGFYQGLADSGANVLQLDIEYLAVADWGLAANGVWHQVYPGEQLTGGGLVKSDAVDDVNAKYLVSQRMSWFFPFNHEDPPRLTAELVYLEPTPCAIRKVAPGEDLFGPVSEASFS
jgi:hypothetical protein